MTPKLFQRRSLELTAAEWEVIESLAAETESIAPSGPNVGKPSWRTLLKRIADKEITLQPRQ
jgi:hypothetical protein